MKASLVLCLFLCLFSLMPKNLAGQWKQAAGPSGGDVYILYRDGSTVYAGSLGALFRSVDKGQSWTVISHSLREVEVGGMLSHAGSVWLGSEGLYRTSNNGVQWEKVLDADWIPAIIAVGSDLFVGVYGEGVKVSRDNGATWSDRSNGLTDNSVNALVGTPGKLFAGTDGGGVFFSSDNGVTWMERNTGLAYGTINRLMYDGTFLFAATGSGGVFRSSDDGQNWTAVNTGLTNLRVYHLLSSQGKLFASTRGGLFLSTNNGDQWTTTGLQQVSVRAVTEIDGALLAASPAFGAPTFTTGGVLRSDDGGSTWVASNTGLLSARVSALTYFSGALYYAGLAGVYASSDDGQTWTEKNQGIEGSSARELLHDESTTLYCLSDAKAFKSTNGGDAWTAVVTGSEGKGGIATWYHDRSTLYASTQDGDFIVSADQGQTWKAQSKPGTFKQIVRKGNALFCAAYAKGIMMSTDDGMTWSERNTGLNAEWGRSIGVKGQVLFAGTQAGLYRSTDDGTSWTPITTGLLPSQSLFTVMSVFSDLVVTTSYKGFIVASTDDGGTWIRREDTLPDSCRLTALAFKDAGANSLVFLGTERQGVWTRPISDFLQGTVILKPKLETDRTSISFPQTAVGKESSAILAVKNVGKAELTILSMGISGPDAGSFVLQNPGLKSIPPDEDLSLEILFRPVDAGRKSAVLTINSNDSTNLVVRVPLSGDGIVPGNLTLWAHYPLSTTANDTTGNLPPMELINTGFLDGGLYCDGDYDRTLAQTPILPVHIFQGFRVSVEFKTLSIPLIERPVFTGGGAYRWTGVILESDTTVSLYYNQTKNMSTMQYSPDTWHEVMIEYDSLSSTAELYFDGKFVNSIQYTLQHGGANDRRFTMSNGANGRAFQGFIRNLRIHGNGSLTNVGGISQKPGSLILRENYPNPFSHSTTIPISISKPNSVAVVVNDILGREMLRQSFGQLDSGAHELILNMQGFHAGVYFYTVQTNAQNKSARMILK